MFCYHTSSTFKINEIGIYFVNKNPYIKYSFGLSKLSLFNRWNTGGFRGRGYSIGYGYSFSLKDSIEITYTHIDTNIVYHNDETDNYKNTFSSIGIGYKHRWF